MPVFYLNSPLVVGKWELEVSAQIRLLCYQLGWRFLADDLNTSGPLSDHPVYQIDGTQLSSIRTDISRRIAGRIYSSQRSASSLLGEIWIAELMLLGARKHIRGIVEKVERLISVVARLDKRYMC
jgi:hypothetical protein